MKKIITILALSSLLAIPVISLAIENQPIPEARFKDISGLMDIIEEVGSWIFTGLMVLAAIFLVVAGYFFLTAGGDPEKLKKAREMVIAALIGVAVGVGAQGLISVIKNLIVG